MDRKTFIYNIDTMFFLDKLATHSIKKLECRLRDRAVQQYYKFMSIAYPVAFIAVFLMSLTFIYLAFTGIVWPLCTMAILKLIAGTVKLARAKQWEYKELIEYIQRFYGVKP